MYQGSFGSDTGFRSGTNLYELIKTVINKFRSSVIVPVYNTGNILKETIDNVLEISNGKDEIIIIDDFSTDKTTLEIINSYKNINPITVTRHDRNRGLGASRNSGVVNSSTDIIVPLDSDDMFPKEYFEKMLAPFSNPEIAFTYCDIQCFGNSNDLWRSEPFRKHLIIDKQYICGCSPFRKEVHKIIGGFCEENVFRYMNEDWDFWLSMCEKNFKGEYVENTKYLYRRTSSSMSSVPRTFSPEVHKRMLERHYNFITNYKPPQQFLANGYLEAGYGHIKLNNLYISIKYCLKLFTIPGRITQSLRLLKDIILEKAVELYCKGLKMRCKNAKLFTTRP